MITSAIFYFLVVVIGTLGEMCISRAMKTIGEASDFRPRAIANHVFLAMKVGWMWLAITLMAVAFFALLGMLAVNKATFVFPATALNYAVAALGGKFFLRERVTSERWFGVAVICAGVLLVILGKG